MKSTPRLIRVHWCPFVVKSLLSAFAGLKKTLLILRLFCPLRHFGAISLSYDFSLPRESGNRGGGIVVAWNGSAVKLNFGKRLVARSPQPCPDTLDIPPQYALGNFFRCSSGLGLSFPCFGLMSWRLFKVFDALPRCS
jgi:hypothetical protein